MAAQVGVFGLGRGIIPPRRLVTWDKAARIRRNLEIWQDPDSVVHRLPEHYKQRYWENILRDKEAVYYRPPLNRFEWDGKKRIRVEKENYPIYPIYPPEADKGLWGGEGVLKGYRISKPFIKKKVLPRHWVPKFWFPALRKEVLYSEVLNRYMAVIVTTRTVRQIDDNFGLDFYLLRTPDIDLCSKLGAKLKREIYLSLARGADCYKDNPKKQQEVLERYKDFVLPEEEAEWISLELNEACRKLQDMEEERAEKEKTPLKIKLEREMVANLRQGLANPPTDPDTPLQSLLNKFRR